MKTYQFATLCIGGLMVWNILLRIAVRLAEVDALAYRTAQKYAINEDEARQFFSESLSLSIGVDSILESLPYILAIVLLLILKRKHVLIG